MNEIGQLRGGGRIEGGSPIDQVTSRGLSSESSTFLETTIRLKSNGGLSPGEEIV